MFCGQGWHGHLRILVSPPCSLGAEGISALGNQTVTPLCPAGGAACGIADTAACSRQPVGCIPSSSDAWTPAGAAATAAVEQPAESGVHAGSSCGWRGSDSSASPTGFSAALRAPPALSQRGAPVTTCVAGISSRCGKLPVQLGLSCELPSWRCSSSMNMCALDNACSMSWCTA